MGRICITITKDSEAPITKEASAQGITKSEWIEQGLTQYLRTRDQKPDQGCDDVRRDPQHPDRERHLEERSKNQVTTIEDLQITVVHGEGIIQTLMEERQKHSQRRQGSGPGCSDGMIREVEG